MRSGLPGPKTPKSSAMKTTTWHCSINSWAQHWPPQLTILTEMMADEFNFLGQKLRITKQRQMQINSYPRPIRITWRMQMWCLAVYMLLCSLFVADLIVGMEELELHCRRRGRYKNHPGSYQMSTSTSCYVGWQPCSLWSNRLLPFGIC